MDLNKMIQQRMTELSQKEHPDMESLTEMMQLCIMSRLSDNMQTMLNSHGNESENHDLNDRTRSTITSDELVSDENKIKKSEPNVKRHAMTRDEFFVVDDYGMDRWLEHENYERAEISRLRKLGYTVAKDSGMSERERQGLLQIIIETNQMSKEKVLGHLQYLIKINGNKSNNGLALKRWKADYSFVESL